MGHEIKGMNKVMEAYSRRPCMIPDAKADSHFPSQLTSRESQRSSLAWYS